MTTDHTEPFWMEVVSRNDAASIFSYFTCGQEPIDRYFHTRAACDMQNVFYAYRCGEDVAGIAAVCCAGIHLDNADRIQLIPAVKIDYFAVAETYQHTPYPGTEQEDRFLVSDAFLCELIQAIRRISETAVGATHIVLYAVPTARHFYERNFFSDFAEFMKPENYAYLDGCVPMYMSLL